MKIDINHLEKLANLELNENERKQIEKQLEETLSFIEILNQINTDKILTTNQVTNLENITRIDEIKSSLSQEEALKNAKETHNGFFKTEAILEEQNI